MPNSMLDRDKYVAGSIARGISKLGKKALKPEKKKRRPYRTRKQIDADKLEHEKSRGLSRFKYGLFESPEQEHLTRKEMPEGTGAFRAAWANAWQKKKDTFTHKGDEYSTDLSKGTTQESLLVPTEREEYVVGGLAKALMPVVKKVAKVFTETDSEKEIKAKLNTVIDKIEGAPLGSSKKEIFKEIAEEEDVALSFVKDANKINSYRSGGGKADSLLGEVAATVRAMVTKPTSGQADAEALGGTPTTRPARRGKGFAALGASLGTAVLTVPATALTTAWFMRNDKEPTPKEASSFEKAFSKAHNAGKETFMFKGTEYSTDVRKGKAEGGDVKATEEAQFKSIIEIVEAGKKDEYNLSDAEITEAYKWQAKQEGQKDIDKELFPRKKNAEGGSSMLVPPEMDMPVDTFTPEEQANAESSQLPDDEMEDGYMDYVLGESLDDGEQEYLMGALESDPRLSEIFDKVVTTASEFSGAGEVEGPGTGVSDSIPARLSDGEFVVTEEATSEIGADNLQTMMDDAERKASGGKVGLAVGGLLGNPSQPLEEEDEDLVAQSMISANQMPSLMGGRR